MSRLRILVQPAVLASLMGNSENSNEKLQFFSGNNPRIYESEIDSKFLMRIIRGYSKFEVSFYQNNKTMIKFCH